MKKLHEQVNPRMLSSENLSRCALDECRGACCVYGVWVDLLEKEDILKHAHLILPHMPPDVRDPEEWFAGVLDDDEHSRSGKVVHTAVENRPDHYRGTACVFCLEDGRCALQVAANTNNLHPWRFKPFYCVLHPLDLDDEGRITLDTAAEMVDETGSCVRHSITRTPLVRTFEPEFRYLLGDKTYADLLRLAEEKSPHE